MNDQEFFDLALKVIQRRASDAEREKLKALIEHDPALKAEFAKIQADASLAKKVLPLLPVAEASSGEFPAYARERLLTKVRQTLGQPHSARPKPMWNWRWLIGFALGVSAILIVLVPVLKQPTKPMVQVAMLDTAGPVRGEDDDLDALKAQWKLAEVQVFNKAGQLDAWKTNRSSDAKVTVKVLYDRAAGEVRVILHGPGKSTERTFPVAKDLRTSLQQATDFIQAQAGK